MLRFDVVRVGGGDAVHCLRCRPGPAGTYATADEILEHVRVVVSTWPGGPGPNVSLRGPEPLAHPEAERIVREAVALGVERLCVTTNGAALAREEFTHGLIAAGVTHVSRVETFGGVVAEHYGTRRRLPK